MKTWKITPLYLGKISANFSFVWPQMNPPLENDFTMSSPYLGFLITGPNRALIVDTGINEKFIVDGKAWGALPAEGGAAYLEKALADQGLKADDIDTVVITHLHNDHAGNCHLFKHARMVFQKDEWLNLLNPYPHQLVRKDYDPGIIDELKTMRLAMVDGDVTLDDGIKLYKIPGGHSLGQQSVAVNTEKGTVVLIGDMCLFNWQLFPHLTELTDMEGNTHAIPAGSPAYGPAIPHMIIYDSFSFYDGVSKVRAIASKDEPGYIIPGHEPSLLVTGI